MINKIIMNIHCELSHISKLEFTIQLMVLLKLMITFNFLHFWSNHINSPVSPGH